MSESLARRLLAGELKGYFDIVPRIEAGNGTVRRGHVVAFGVNFVVHVRVQATKAISAGVVGYIGFHGLRLHI